VGIATKVFKVMGSKVKVTETFAGGGIDYRWTIRPSS